PRSQQRDCVGLSPSFPCTRGRLLAYGETSRVVLCGCLTSFGMGPIAGASIDPGQPRVNGGRGIGEGVGRLLSADGRDGFTTEAHGGARRVTTVGCGLPHALRSTPSRTR